MMLGFDEDFGGGRDEIERSRAERDRIARQGAEDVAEIHAETRADARRHAEYWDWQRRHKRWDVSFKDWDAGRYVHLVVDD